MIVSGLKVSACIGRDKERMLFEKKERGERMAVKRKCLGVQTCRSIQGRDSEREKERE